MTMDVVLNIVSSKQLLIVPHPSQPIIPMTCIYLYWISMVSSPEPDAETEEEDEDGRGYDGPEQTTDSSQHLDTQEMEATSMQQTIVARVSLYVVLVTKQSHCHHAPQSRHSVHCSGP